jgi:branched-chain amino acid aminotransferase
MDLQIVKSKALKPKYTDESALGFGKIFTDHMFTMRYDTDQGWHDLKIEPFADFSLSPAAMVFHYGQEAFEGLKAYKNEKGEVTLFRPWENVRRMNSTCRRLCMPELDEEKVLEALYELVRIDADWIPVSEGTSLYIRPTIIATDPYLGVRPSNTYIFYIILSPVGAYYSSGLKPVNIYVEKDYVRSAKGGTGSVKTGGNYAASLIASDKAKKNHCEQSLWLDAREREYVEEVGSMNILFKIDGKIVTPALEGSILPGITRDSVLKLAKKLGYTVEERKVGIHELIKAHEEGKLEEVFGSGTAAVISPVGGLVYDGKKYVINNNEMGPVARELYDTLTGIQNGLVPDPFDWMIKIK